MLVHLASDALLRLHTALPEPFAAAEELFGWLVLVLVWGLFGLVVAVVFVFSIKKKKLFNVALACG